MHDYKSLRVAVMICVTLVNTQTHMFWPVVLLAQLLAEHKIACHMLQSVPITKC